MRNDEIRAQLAENDAGQLNREEKNITRKSSRGAFNSFFKSTTGNTHLGREILRNGFNTAAEFHNLLRECYTYQDSAEYTKLLDEQNAKLSCRADLRQQAFRAGDDVKCAKYLQRQLEKGTLSEDMLSDEQRKLMVLFETGELDKRRRAANIAYGHGAGSEGKVLSIDKIMTINAFYGRCADVA